MPFEGVLGQSRPRNIIKNAIRNNKLSHAYLFYGENSIGRMPMALELAKTLNCTDAVSEDNCGQCSSCKKIDSGIHPDISIIEPEKSSSSVRLGAIKIEALRDLQKKLAYRPYEGKCKVAVIDSSESMNPQAANSFLKMLEEPPPQTLFVLIANNPHQLLPTLVSRCQAIRFMPLTPMAIKQLLMRFRDRGDIEASDDQLELRAMRSGGTIEKAMEENLLEFCEHREELSNLIERIHISRMDVFIRWSKSVVKESAEAPSLLSELAQLLRDIAIIKNCGESAPIANIDMREQLAALAKNKKTETLIKMFNAALIAKDDLASNYNAQLSLDNLWLSFCEAA